MHKLEKPCRIILIIHTLLTLAGYIVFIQAQYQLVSPIIPSSTLFEIVKGNMHSSLIVGVALIPSLLFYFFQKRIVTLIISGSSIVFYYFIFNLVW
ncbi:MAG: hypothetical protein JST86_13315 [Bacteroidetes bacterium]|nr:hypothetical protein [Bacteroidota bacterium]